MSSFLNLEELEGLAAEQLPAMVMGYYASGAETQQSVWDNRAAYNQYRILPRIMVDVSSVDTTCNIFGALLLACLLQQVSLHRQLQHADRRLRLLAGYQAAMPLMVAPMAMHGLAHSEMEPGTAKGALQQRTPMVRHYSAAHQAATGSP
jgi:isopentenyl diphosphate isomerase/L-lactate dehydrogenase-like FMN-dependent dehydrogenase